MPRGLALDLRERRMYWTEGGTQKLRSATLDGQDLRDVVVKTEVQEAPRDVAVDAEQRKVYWTALCCGLRRADLNGENEEVVANAEFASGVTVNKDVLYWADWMNGRILRRSPSGLEEPIVTGLASPVDVALDAGSGMIYWSDVGHARTQRALLDGRGIQALNMSWAIMNTYGMAIDASDRKLYMTDFEKTGDFTGSASDYAGRIIRTNLDGSDAEVLVSEPGMSMSDTWPYGVAVDPESAQVYWTDRKAGRIQRLTLKCPAGVLEVASRMNSSNIKDAHPVPGMGDHTVMSYGPSNPLFVTAIGAVVLDSKAVLRCAALMSGGTRHSGPWQFHPGDGALAGITVDFDCIGNDCESALPPCKAGAVSGGYGPCRRFAFPSMWLDVGRDRNFRLLPGYNGSMTLACNNNKFSLNAGSFPQQCRGGHSQECSSTGSAAYSLNLREPDARYLINFGEPAGLRRSHQSLPTRGSNDRPSGKWCEYIARRDQPAHGPCGDGGNHSQLEQTLELERKKSKSSKARGLQAQQTWTSGGRKPVLIMGGWGDDTPAEETLKNVKQMVEDLRSEGRKEVRVREGDRGWGSSDEHSAGTAAEDTVP
ncbi:LRP5 [Symbiodinium sp. CCMP2592]|nr:LRP5 [Symbiodinium sp. CCMP2592]